MSYILEAFLLSGVMGSGGRGWGFLTTTGLVGNRVIV
jgi:hypothetical protein